VKRLYYSYNDFLIDLGSVVTQLREKRFDSIVAISRGGLTMAHYLSLRLNIRDVKSINAVSYDDDKMSEDIEIFGVPDKLGKNVLIVDEIADSGRTLKATTELLKDRFSGSNISTFTLFYKDSSIFKPDLHCQEAVEWIDFFWEVDS
jgi:xanthine phosphoribosyltransferase